MDQQLRVTSWHLVCVTKHLELPNITIQLELLAFFPLHFFFLSLYNKHRESHHMMTPVLFSFQPRGHSPEKASVAFAIWPSKVSSLNHADRQSAGG